jgi:hypothetical protein
MYCSGWLFPSFSFHPLHCLVKCLAPASLQTFSCPSCPSCPSLTLGQRILRVLQHPLARLYLLAPPELIRKQAPRFAVKRSHLHPDSKLMPICSSSGPQVDVAFLSFFFFVDLDVETSSTDSLVIGVETSSCIALVGSSCSTLYLTDNPIVLPILGLGSPCNSD